MRTKVLVNATVSPTADFVKNPDWQLRGTDLQADIVDAAGARNVDFVPAGKLATALMGDAIATNMFMLGYAFQQGRVPLAEESLARAIELNGIAVEFNRKAFLWGRRDRKSTRLNSSHRCISYAVFCLKKKKKKKNIIID